MTVTYTDEQDALMHEFMDALLPLFGVLGQILERAAQSNLVSPVEQAEIATMLATFLNLYTRIDAAGL